MSPLTQTALTLACLAIVAALIGWDAFGCDITARVAPLRRRWQARQIARELSDIRADEIAAMYLTAPELERGRRR